MKLVSSDEWKATHDRITSLTAQCLDLTERAAKAEAERDQAQASLRLEVDTVATLRKQLLDARKRQHPSKSKLTTTLRAMAMRDGQIDRRLLSYLRSQANQMLNDNLDEVEVIENLGKWITTEGQDAITADRIADAHSEAFT